MYLGWRHPDVFGRVGSLSGSYWLRGFIEGIPADAPRPLRVWLDSGNAGSSADGLEGTVWVRDALWGHGFVLEDDLAHTVGFGHGHNEVAWRERVGEALEFLFPAR